LAKYLTKQNENLNKILDVLFFESTCSVLRLVFDRVLIFLDLEMSLLLHLYEFTKAQKTESNCFFLFFIYINSLYIRSSSFPSLQFCMYLYSK